MPAFREELSISAAIASVRDRVSRYELADPYPTDGVATVATEEEAGPLLLASCWFAAMAAICASYASIPPPPWRMVDGRPMEIGLKASAAANSTKLRAGERTLIVANFFQLYYSYGSLEMSSGEKGECTRSCSVERVMPSA